MSANIVRPATVNEWKAWKELRLKALQDSPQSLGELYADAAKKTDDEWKGKMQEVASSSIADTLFAIIGEQPVGMMYVFVRNDQKNTGGIGGLWVSSEHRQQGIGKDLVLAALDWLTKKHLKRVTFWNNKDNPTSSAFYEKIGFVYSGVEKPLESDPSFTIGEMVKDLEVQY